MDTDGDGKVSDAEAAAYAQQQVHLARLGSRPGGRRLTSSRCGLTQLGISFPMGQGNPTMRLVCVYAAPLAGSLARRHVGFLQRPLLRRAPGLARDHVAGDGTTIGGSDLAPSPPPTA